MIPDPYPAVPAQCRPQLRAHLAKDLKACSVYAALAPFRIGGKPGTSEKLVGAVYSEEKVMTFVAGVTSIGAPRYLFLTILDDQRGLPETIGFRIPGWPAVPQTRQVGGEALPWTASAH